MNLHDLALYKAMEGEGSSVTVEPLEVTENGEYSEEGKAYSPVTVNVAHTNEYSEIDVDNKTAQPVSFFTVIGIDDGNRTALGSKSQSIKANEKKTIQISRMGTTSTVAFNDKNYQYYGIIFVKNIDTGLTMTASAGTLKYGRVSAIDNSVLKAYGVYYYGYNLSEKPTITITNA